MRFHLSFQNQFNPRFFLQRLLLVLVGFWTAAPVWTQVNTYTVKGISFKMVQVHGGTFIMGCTEEQSDECEFNESPSHLVWLSDYSIGETEVTQALWYAVMEMNPSQSSPNCPTCPVENVSWEQVQDFLRELNAMTGKHFRLPTEAEWEFAARGGENGLGYKYCGGHVVYKIAWMNENAEDKTHPVKGKKANELGLYDMSGNVWEMCSDWYDGAYNSYSQKNPTGPATSFNRVFSGGRWGTARVIRGGGFYNEPKYCRVSSRSFEIPGNRTNSLGFRLVSD